MAAFRLIARAGAVLALVAGLSAFKVIDAPGAAKADIEAENRARANPPRSASPLWEKLRQCKIGFDRDAGLYSIQVTPEVQAMVGRSIEVNGFVLPLDGGPLDSGGDGPKDGLGKTAHFLITGRSQDCMFCPPVELNDVVEVRAAQPVAWGDDPITVTGRFSVVEGGKRGVFFMLTDAVPAALK